jgi:dolichol-phosphate mannosyltransferase
MIIAYVIPTYNESLTLPILLTNLTKLIGPQDLIIVADDSSLEEQEFTRAETEKYKNVFFLPGLKKGGRGAAVHRSMTWIIEHHEYVTHIVETDCDGSHRLEDIIGVSMADESLEFVIGSRYMQGSYIRGWSKSRRAMSRVLNLVIPKLLNVECSDITNGLRRYSRSAATILVQDIPNTKGFIYLSEQALILSQGGIKSTEMPILFESRVAGVSSVTSRDLFNSLLGLIHLLSIRLKLL